MGSFEQPAVGEIIKVPSDGVRRDSELARTLHDSDSTALFCDLQQFGSALCGYCIIRQTTPSAPMFSSERIFIPYWPFPLANFLQDNFPRSLDNAFFC